MHDHEGLPRRIDPKAYDLVRLAFQLAMDEAEAASPRPPGPPRVRPQALCAWVCALARERYGPSAPWTLRRWGLLGDHVVGRVVAWLGVTSRLQADEPAPDGAEPRFEGAGLVGALVDESNLRDPRVDCLACGWPLAFKAEERGLVRECTNCFAFVDVPP